MDYRVRCYVPGKPFREWRYPTRHQADKQRDGILRTARLEGAPVTVIVRPPSGKSERTVLEAGPPKLLLSPSIAARGETGAAARRRQQQEAETAAAAVPPPEPTIPGWQIAMYFLMALIGVLPRRSHRGASRASSGKSWGSGGGGDFGGDL
ncbi:hypothetical protein SGL43_06585 [Streptomyces globisporus]|uniref:Uncharacterized protein n=1 Tax=Streptomyces globisporus TaxID=1908 RepID=A0ABM9H7A8_STRGL|nr:hypothetical protein [Streptomyces globisporus]CAH9419530.1 hypothetical protein SGL43_06585 [Streptomyces globisporus]